MLKNIFRRPTRKQLIFLVVYTIAVLILNGCTRSSRMRYDDLEFHGKVGKTAGLISTPIAVAADIVFFPVQVVTLYFRGKNIWPVEPERPESDWYGMSAITSLKEHFCLPGYTVEAGFYYAGAGIAYPVNLLQKGVSSRHEEPEELTLYDIQNLTVLSQKEYERLVALSGRYYAPTYVPAYKLNGKFSYRFGAKERMQGCVQAQQEWEAWLKQDCPAGSAEEMRFALKQATRFGFPRYWQGDPVSRVRLPFVPNDEASIREIVYCFRYASTSVARLASHSLLELGDKAINPLIAGLDSSSVDVRQKAAELLGESKAAKTAPEVVIVLLRRLEDNQWEVRKTAAISLGQIGKVSAVNGLEAHYKDNSLEVRQAVIWALGRIADPSCSKTLSEAASDQSLPVRLEAIGSMERLKKDGVPLLIAELSNDNRLVRARVASTLGEMKDPRAVDPLINAIDDPDPRAAGNAAYALDSFSGEKLIEPLLKALKSKHREVRAGAAYALDFSDDPRVIAALERALDDEDDIVRGAARQSLDFIKSGKGR